MHGPRGPRELGSSGQRVVLYVQRCVDTLWGWPAHVRPPRSECHSTVPQHSAGLGRGDLLLTKPEQGETETHQDEASPQKTEDSD
jgi:hypothetical protein